MDLPGRDLKLQKNLQLRIFQKVRSHSPGPSRRRRPSRRPPPVPDDGVVRRVDHGAVVDGGEVSVHQLKLVRAQQRGPDGFDLDVGEVLSDAAMAACGEKTASCSVKHADLRTKDRGTSVPAPNGT